MKPDLTAYPRHKIKTRGATYHAIPVDDQKPHWCHVGNERPRVTRNGTFMPKVYKYCQEIVRWQVRSQQNMKGTKWLK